MTSSGKADWDNPFLLQELKVCLKCFSLRGQFRGKEHRCTCSPRDDAWREKEWPGYDIAALVDICNLCARSTMKSGTRFSWLVCDQCRAVNSCIGQVFGSSGNGALPVGRHSLMNRVSLGGGEEIDEVKIREFSSWLWGLTKVWSKLFDWGPAEAKRLADDAGMDGGAVPLDEWMTRFPSSEGASVDSFCRYVEYDLPAHPKLDGLSLARNRFLEREAGG